MLPRAADHQLRRVVLASSDLDACRWLHLPRNHSPVGESISPGAPAASTSPPAAPAPGPDVDHQSAARMISSSCSTTTTVFPKSRKPGQRADQPRRCPPRAARCSARPARRSRRTDPRRAGSPAGCAAPRRRRACRSCDRSVR